MGDPWLVCGFKEPKSQLGLAILGGNLGGYRASLNSAHYGCTTRLARFRRKSTENPSGIDTTNELVRPMKSNQTQLIIF